jgi:MFS transporter, MHS family, proline/betaine transporter
MVMKLNMVARTTISRAVQRRAVVACLLGYVFEGLDFVVFGMLSFAIGRNCFPAEDETATLLLALGTFGIGYVIRPLGGIFLGAYADRHGRKPALALLSFLMALGTALIAVTPGYATIGIAAPVIMVLARMIQGFSLGGEFASATSLLVEYATPGRRGFYASWQMVAQVGTIALGSVGVYAISQALSPAAFSAWGWRLPFVFGLLIAPIGYYIRARTEETPEFLAYRRAKGPPGRAPLFEVVRDYPREIVFGAGIVLAGTSVFYLVYIYVPIFAVQTLGLALGATQLTTLAAALLSGMVILWAADLSDRRGRRGVLLMGAIGSAVAGYPLFSHLLASPGIASLLLFQAGMAAIFGFIAGPAMAALSEVYPVHIRSSGVGFVYNLVVAIFGGLGPVFAEWLTTVTGDKAATAYWMTATGIAGAAMISSLKRAPANASRP